MGRPTKFHKTPSNNRFFNCARRASHILEREEGIFEFEDLFGCTVVPKDILISCEDTIVDSLSHSRKVLYSKPI